MSEKFPQPKPIINPEQSRKEAAELMASHQKEIEDIAYTEVDGVDGNYGHDGYPNLIAHFTREVPEEQLQRFWGHGITRGRVLDQLTAAINILENRAMIGDSAQLKSSWQSTWTDGPFLVISEKDKALVLGNTHEERGRNLLTIGANPYTGEDVRAIKINIEALVVNAKFYPLVEDLRKRFPDVNIIYARDLPAYLSQ